MEPLTLESVKELTGMALYVPVIYALVEVIKKMINPINYDKWLPVWSIIIGVVVIAMPAYIGGTSIELAYQGILTGGVVTGGVSAWYGRKKKSDA